MASIASSQVTLHCKGILFDMDGILISSIASVERSWTKWALMRNVDPAHALSIAHGCRAIETVAKLRPDLDSESELKVIEEIEVADGEGVMVLPGVLDLLESLPPDKWTVVTSATERLARARMAGAGIAVPERIVTAEFVTYGKPHPEPFLAGARLLGVAPAECVVLEDSSSGVIAGRDAGCTVIATPFSHPADALDSAHYMVADLTGVTAQILAEDLTLQFVPLGARIQ